MTNSQLELMQKKDILLGAKESFLNAKALFQSAKTIAESKAYGPANSLLILSVEECIKCMILTSVYLGRKLDFNIYPFFSSHDRKHQEAGKIQPFINSFSCFAPILMDSLKKRRPKSGTLMDLGLSLVFSSLFGVMNEVERFKTWWSNQNELKNKGLYVGYEGSNWVVPRDISKELFNETLAFAAPFINCTELVIELRDDDYKILPKGFFNTSKES